MKPLLHLSEDFLRGLGVVDWGYTEELEASSFPRYREWLAQNPDVFPYLHEERNVANRESIGRYWPAARGALVFFFSYLPAKKALVETGETKLAAYTLGFEGTDYHQVLRRRLNLIMAELKRELPLEALISLDTQAVLERDLAYRAGLGWIGKNSMLISREHGSYFLLGSILVDRKLPLELPTLTPDHCGSCVACVAGCPTQAIDPVTRTLRANACISTWTIETRAAAAPAPAGMEQASPIYFGCDICQDVCPWNTRKLATATAALSERARAWVEFFARPAEVVLSELAQHTNRGFLRFFDGTPFGRPGKPAFLRNILFWLKRS